MKFQFLERIRSEDTLSYIKSKAIPIFIGIIILQTIFVMNINSSVTRIQDSLRYSDPEVLESRIDELESQIEELKSELEEVSLEVESNTSNIDDLDTRLTTLEISRF